MSADRQLDDYNSDPLYIEAGLALVRLLRARGIEAVMKAYAEVISDALVGRFMEREKVTFVREGGAGFLDPQSEKLWASWGEPKYMSQWDRPGTLERLFVLQLPNLRFGEVVEIVHLCEDLALMADISPLGWRSPGQTLQVVFRHR